MSNTRIVTVILTVVTLFIASSAVAAAQAKTDIFLPLIAIPAPALPTQPLGEATINSGPTPCGTEECYTLLIRCDQLANSQSAFVKVGSPTGASTPRGTIVFASGWIGNYWWDEGAPSNVTIVNELRAAGFQTVQIQWQQNWFLAGNQSEDLGDLACRPATIMRWVYDNLQTAAADQAFCATGHSNGASQVAYSMVRYGLSDIFDMALLESGPNWSRIDHSCILDPAHQELFGDAGERNTIDWSFGFPNDGSGICARNDATQIKAFQRASLVETGWPYSFPNTLLVFAFGESDTTTTASHGKYFYQKALDAGSPLLATATIPAAPHFITEVAAGAEFIKTQLLDECRVR